MLNNVVYIIAGPNGSGKTTFAKEFLKEHKLPFINADEIALSMSPQDIGKARIKAGKTFLNQIDKLIDQGKSFVFETTLAGQYVKDIIQKLKKNRYEIILIYIFVESQEEGLNRIKIRVQKGGHPIPEEDIRRRFHRSKKNFWNIYRKEVNRWRMFINSKDEFVEVAVGEKEINNVINENAFRLFKEGI